MQPDEDNKLLPSQKLTPSDTLLLRELTYKRNYFSRHKKLAPDGSFFYSDEKLAEENGVSEKTIMRSKRRLRQAGKIKFEIGKHQGWSTKYWIISEDDKKSRFVLAKKGDLLSRKSDSLNFKARQNVTPNDLNNKLKNNFEKKEMTEKEREEMLGGFKACIESLKRKSHESI